MSDLEKLEFEAVIIFLLETASGLFRSMDRNVRKDFAGGGSELQTSLVNDSLYFVTLNGLDYCLRKNSAIPADLIFKSSTLIHRP
jgi:hypothetical protein